MALLDIRDAELRLWGAGEIVRSPGFVLLDGTEYRFGEAALGVARQRPRDVNNRYWWQLSTQPLKPALGPARHTADLVHAHLRDLHKAAGSPAELALVVPDSMPREQLSLLLGIVQASDFKAIGLVSRSVLQASSADMQSRCLHLELQLHQGVINEIGPADGELALLRSTPLPACGLLALQERCVSAIAGSFIQQTRFDPRQRADTEQALYNQLPAILTTLAERGECSVDIDGNRCRVVASALSSVTDRLREALVKVLGGESLPVLLDPQITLLTAGATLPGDLQPLGDEALWNAYQQHEARIHSEGDALHLVDRLPPGASSGSGSASPGVPASTLDAAPQESPRAEQEESPQGSRVTNGTVQASQAAPAQSSAAVPGQPTHILLGTQARALRGERIELGGAFFLERREQHWTLHGEGALINGMPSAPQQPLALGDTLSLGTTGHGRLIEVVD